MTRMPEHEAALDALCYLVRIEFASGVSGVYDASRFGDIVDEGEMHLFMLLVDAGRMEWCGRNGNTTDHARRYARFVPKPKPLLSEEQVAEVMRWAWDLSSAPHQHAKGERAHYLRAYLTSLTQPARDQVGE